MADPVYTASIRHLRAFLAVARHRSFSRAALELHLSQPSLSLVIKQFEGLAGVALFERTTRNIVLTPEGADLHPVAEQVVEHFDTTIQNIRVAGDQRRSRVGIAAVHAVATRVVPHILRRFLDHYPNVQFHLREGHSSEVRSLVQRNQVDLGFASRLDDEAELDFSPLFRDRLGVIGRHDHPLLASDDAINWHDMDGHDYIGMTFDTATAPIIEGIESLPASMRKPRYRVSTNSTVWALLKQGFGITTTPAMVADADPTLKFRPLSEPEAWRNVYLVTRRGRALSLTSKQLVRLVREDLASMAAANPLIQVLGD